MFAFQCDFLKSKWDNDFSENKLGNLIYINSWQILCTNLIYVSIARLDGTNKPMKHTIEDYLQMDGWEPPPSSTNGKKRVKNDEFNLFQRN